jgi:hypothetical protein
VPVRKFAQPVLEIQIEFVNDSRIEPHTGHKNEVSSGLVSSFQRTERDANRDRVQQLAGRMVGPVREPDFVSQNVCRPRGQNTKMHLGPGDSVHNFIDRAIASRRENQIAAVVNGFRRKFAGPLRTRRRKEFDVPARFLEDANGFIQTCPSRPF